MKSITIACKAADTLPLEKLTIIQGNLKSLSDSNSEKLKNSILKYGFSAPIFVWESGIKKPKYNILDGTQRVAVLKMLQEEKYKIPDLPVVYITAKNKKEAMEKLLHITSSYGEFDREGLDLFLLGIDADEEFLETLRLTDDEYFLGFLDGEDIIHIPNVLLKTFTIPPFSILDTRQGYWQKRKGEWKELIGDYAESREGLLFRQNAKNPVSKKLEKGGLTASLLDPVLAEISIKWFGFDKCKTYDCFAGDSVFGYVSSYLGHAFTGIELREDQTDLNNQRIKEFKKSKYICDDGQNILTHINKNSQDLLFSCPPYYDLEVYSDMDNDASNQSSYKDFIKILDNAFTNAIECLKENRFAVIVVGDIRDKKTGIYRNFPNDIKKIFLKNKMLFYNELILVEIIGSARLRAQGSMKNRKVVKVHQNVLVFYKGDTNQIKNIFPKIEVQSDESTII